MTATSAASGVVSTVPDVSEVRRLREKLNMSEEWCTRLQRQIQDLLRLPYNDTEKLRQKMSNPEIAIPLLQCYDATIKAKEDEVEKLNREVDRLRGQNGLQLGTDREVVENARVAEETAKEAIHRAEQEIRHSQQQVQRLLAENATLKEKINAQSEDDNRLHNARKKDKQEIAELQEQISEFRKRCAQMETDMAIMDKKLKSRRDVDDSERNATEAQKVQVHLLQKENDDKVQEIERLRQKMVQAIRQAAENHASHLKILEDKHRSSMEAVRDEVRAHEVTILKLRAQFSRLDVLGGGGGVVSGALVTIGGGSGRVEYSPSDTLTKHAYELQEVELRRLTAEVTSLQIQRDDALYKLEQVSAQRKSQESEALRNCRKDLEVSKSRAVDLEERNQSLQDKVAELRDAVREAKDKQDEAERNRDAAIQQLQRTRDESRDMDRKIQSQELRLHEAEVKLKTSTEDADRRIQNAEARAEEVRKDEAVRRDRITAQLNESQRMVEELRNDNSALLSRLSAAEGGLMERQRSVEALQQKVEHLSSVVDTLHQQLQQSEDRVSAYTHQEAMMRDDLRTMALDCERLRLENIRGVREVERLQLELQARKKYYS